MGTSAEDICFGGVKVINADADEDFNLEFEPQEGKIEISGYAESGDDTVAVEILNIGKTEQELLSITSANVSDNIIYANIVKANNDRYYKCEFSQEALTGQYLVRVRPSKSHKAMSKLLNYFNCYDAVNVKFTDKDNNEVNSLSRLDYLHASIDFESRIESINAWMALAVYDGNNRLTGVNQKSFTVLAGERQNIDLEVNLNNKMSDGSKAKIFFMKDFDTLKPIIRPVIL